MLDELNLWREKPIRFAIPAFDGLDVFGEEEAWVRRVLAEPGIPALLGRLLRFQGPFARRQLVLRPGALNVTFHLSHVGACTGRDHFAGWSLDWINLAIGYLPRNFRCCFRH